MRYRWTVIAVLLAGLLGGAGPAGADPAGTVLTDDRYGVLLGAADAPVQLEIFCEPQCSDCAKFEAAAADQLARQLAGHRLAVTYRWLTFLDQRRNNDASAQLANALMLAADPATAPIAYQNFVAQLYRQQDRLHDDPDPGDVADIARASGVPDPVADRIAAFEPAADIAAMDAANRLRLRYVAPENPTTPTVYDLRTNTVVDTGADGWLDKLMAAG